MKTKCRLIALLAVLALAAGIREAAAQCQLARELERAQEHIERARPVVERGPETAKQLLRSAVARLAEARGAERRGDRERGCRLAAVAQKLAGSAVDLSRRQDGGLDRLETALTQTDEYLERIRHQVARCERSEARRALATAARQQEEARRAFASRRAPLAIQLTRMAREGAERARRLCQRDPGPLETELLSRQLERTDELIERAAQALLDEETEATSRAEQIDAARRRQSEAWRHLDEDRLVAAWSATRQARLLVARALGTWDGGPRAERVGRLIDSTADLLAGLRESSRLEEARRNLAQEHVAEALAAARAASALALDVAEMLERGERD
jgi:hypothetical protein